jgi:hypothetical protein
MEVKTHIKNIVFVFWLGIRDDPLGILTLYN